MCSYERVHHFKGWNYRGRKFIQRATSILCCKGTQRWSISVHTSCLELTASCSIMMSFGWAKTLIYIYIYYKKQLFTPESNVVQTTQQTSLWSFTLGIKENTLPFPKLIFFFTQCPSRETFPPKVVWIIYKQVLKQQDRETIKPGEKMRRSDLTTVFEPVYIIQT